MSHPRELRKLSAVGAEHGASPSAERLGTPMNRDGRNPSPEWKGEFEHSADSFIGVVEKSVRNSAFPEDFLTLEGKRLTNDAFFIRNWPILRSIVLVFTLRFPRLRRSEDSSFVTKDQSRFFRDCMVIYRNLCFFTTSDNKEQSFAKYWLDVIMCKVFHDTQRPEVPSWLEKRKLFPGIFGRYVARMVAKRDLSFCYSLSKGAKQSWPPLGNLKVLDSLKKHRERLSRPISFLQSDKAVHELRTAAYQVFKKPDRLPTKMMPSGSACLQASRQNGGALSLFEVFRPDENADDPRSLDQQFADWKQRTYDYARGMAEVNFDPMVKVTMDDGKEFISRLKEFELPAYHYGMKSETDDEPIVSDWPVGHRVKAVVLLEPAKVRIISKMCGFSATALQPLQGMLLSDWKDSSYSTMRDEDLTPRVQEIHENSMFPMWVSGDYEAATDLINSQATMTVIQHLQDSGYPNVDLAKMTLFSKVIEYPKIRADGCLTKDVQLPPVLSQNGQLMGHPLSFPILCVINLAVYRLSLRRWRDIMLMKYPEKEFQIWTMYKVSITQVIVNGDDILFKSDDLLYQLFLQTSQEFGLKPSIGKNYYSPDCCMINSQIFKFDGSKMTRREYLNQRFVYGTDVKKGMRESQSPVKGEVEGANPVDLAGGLNKMFYHLPWTREILPTIMRRWSSQWSTARFQPNWFLPIELGGLGIFPIFAKDPDNIKVTRDQRRVASRFASNPKLCYFKSLTVEGIQSKNKRIESIVERFHLISGDQILISDEVEVDWEARLKVSDYGKSFVSEGELYDSIGVGWEARIQSMERVSIPHIKEDIRFVINLKDLKSITKADVPLMTNDTQIERYWFSKKVTWASPICPSASVINVGQSPYIMRKKIEDVKKFTKINRKLFARLNELETKNTRKMWKLFGYDERKIEDEIPYFTFNHNTHTCSSE